MDEWYICSVIQPGVLMQAAHRIYSLLGCSMVTGISLLPGFTVQIPRIQLMIFFACYIVVILIEDVRIECYRSDITNLMHILES